ncbi:MAG: hypothetical protein H6550_08560 [Chitinophagales bacterium]|nr:hypothetical protein [Chitinophagales bacterium]
MMNRLLLPHWFRKTGLALLPFAIVLMILAFFYEYDLPFLAYNTCHSTKDFLDTSNHNLTDELAVVSLFACLFFLAFSKEKHEDEYLNEVRLKALQISVYINYIVLAVATVTVYGLSYMYVLYGNLFTILVIFILVYYYRVHIKGRLAREEQI